MHMGRYIIKQPTILGMSLDNKHFPHRKKEWHPPCHICYQSEVHGLKQKVGIPAYLCNSPICLILCCRGTAWRKISSLQDRICVPTNSVEPNILWVSSARFTPPIAATSLSSPPRVSCR
jgi:hypothetical protein